MKKSASDRPFHVTVKVEGRDPWETTVTAPREGLAETRAILAWLRSDDHAPLRGEHVEFDVTPA